MQKTALITSGIVFGLLAISHAIRWLSPVKGTTLMHSMFGSVTLL